MSDCSKCDGNGIVECPECGGFGCDNCDNGSVVCDECGGTGEIEDEP